MSVPSETGTPAQHTPGPWVASFLLPWVSQAGSDKSVASVYGEGARTLDPVAYANARLIAAAPDMLAALEEIIEAAEYRGFHPEFLINAHAAVKKARGQS